jgi:putative sigma-54 modulation protein
VSLFPPRIPIAVAARHFSPRISNCYGISAGDFFLAVISDSWPDLPFLSGALGVQINISTRHGRLSDASQEKIKAKVGKLDRFFERLTSIDVTIDLTDEENPRVDLQVSAEHKHDFVATDQSDNLMGSVDATVQKMEQQLRKYKERVQDRHRQPGGARRTDVAAGEGSEE